MLKHVLIEPTATYGCSVRADAACRVLRASVRARPGATVACGVASGLVAHCVPARGTTDEPRERSSRARCRFAPILLPLSERPCLRTDEWLVGMRVDVLATAASLAEVDAVRE